MIFNYDKIKTVTKFNNLLIKKGKRNRANNIVLKTLFFLKKKTKKNPLNIFYNVIKMLTPGVTTRKTVIAGRLYHVPSSITRNKALYFSCYWLQQGAKESKEFKHHSLSKKIYEECLKVQRKKGQSYTMFKQHNKMVSSNRSFLRFVRRKFKPRVPNAVWRRQKQLLWLKTHKPKKPRRKFHESYSTQMLYTRENMTYRNINFNPKKYAKKTRYKVYKLFERVRINYNNRIKSKLVKLKSKSKSLKKKKKKKKLSPKNYKKFLKQSLNYVKNQHKYKYNSYQAPNKPVVKRNTIRRRS